jgi:ABC-type transport system substrate-binding protein
MLRPAHIKTIIINYKTDELTRELDLENSKVQAAIINFPGIANVMQKDAGAYIPNTGLSGSIEFLFLNTAKPPTNNTLVRRAIIAAINVTEIQQIAYGGYAVPYVGPLPKGYPGYNDSIKGPTYNVTLAKQLLAQAGYPNGQGLPTINFLYPAYGYMSSVAQIVTADLAQIGITIQPQQVTYDAWIGQVAGVPNSDPKAPLMSYAGVSDFPDLTGYEFWFDSCFGVAGVPHNQTICDQITKSNNELNPQARLVEISQATQLLQQSSAFIWLGQPIDFYDTGVGFGPVIWNKCVTGMWFAGSFNGVDFNSLYYTCTPT